MAIRDKRREDAVECMADHLLLEGLEAATLRLLAAAAGTSDRMLLYYFNDKDEILAATLHRIAERLLAQLDAAVPVGRARPFPALLREVRAALETDSIRPFMPLWLELAAAAARGRQPHAAVASDIADGFLPWIACRLKAEGGGNLAASTALFMVSIEGVFLLEAIGRRGVVTSAVTELARHLSS